MPLYNKTSLWGTNPVNRPKPNLLPVGLPGAQQEGLGASGMRNSLAPAPWSLPATRTVYGGSQPNPQKASDDLAYQNQQEAQARINQQEQPIPRAGIQIGGSTYQQIQPETIVSPYQASGPGFQGSAPGVSRGAYENQALLALQQQGQQNLLGQRAQLSDETFNKRLGAVQGLFGATPGGPASTIPAFDETGARAAAFARAKDQAGMTAHASLQALQDLMAERGLRGSTIEGSGIADILEGGAGGVNEFTREQLIQDLNRAAQVSDREASMGLTRRGQDLAYQQSLMALLNAGGALY